jgi:NADH-quinone oxidoreductase subunit I
VSRIPGSGLAKGLAVTAKAMTRRSVTQQYPDVKPELPPRSRGVIALLEENCTVCMLCARECPDWCIYIDSHKEVVPAKEEGARDRTRNVLDRFAIDFSLCMYCGICVEVCPFDALFWSPEFEYAELDIRELVHEKDRLREWMWTVPPPPPLDSHAERPEGGRRRAQGGRRAGRRCGAAARARRARRHVPGADRPARTGATVAPAAAASAPADADAAAGAAAGADAEAPTAAQPSAPEPPDRPRRRPGQLAADWRPGGTEPPPASEPTLGSTPDELA